MGKTRPPSREELWAQIEGSAPIAAEKAEASASPQINDYGARQECDQAIDPRTLKVPKRENREKTSSTDSAPAQMVISDSATANESNITQEQEGNPSEKELTVSQADFHLDQAEALPPASFPNPPRIGNYAPTTIPNVEHLLTSYGITARYDVIKKNLLITVPGVCGTSDNADNVAMAHIVSLANLNGMAIGQVPTFVGAIGDRNPYNPVADWINSKPWDGIDRLPNFYDTLTEREGFPGPLKERLIYRWLLSAVAAALKPSGFRNRGVLTLQGPQSIGKTAWVSALVPDIVLRERLIKLDHHLDAGNKDSLINAISHWIVEIGELDSSFKRDVSRLKGFITADSDKIRRPYAHTASEYPRRTVFCATVNDYDFLVDSTGNTRWWTVPVTRVNYQHGIDMQQLFAQVAEDYRKGEQWWLTDAEEGLLEKHNKSHRQISFIEEHILALIEPDRVHEEGLLAMTATEMLMKIGIERPTNTQSKECNRVLRQYLGDSKRIKGQNKWRIPFAKRPDIIDDCC